MAFESIIKSEHNVRSTTLRYNCYLSMRIGVVNTRKDGTKSESISMRFDDQLLKQMKWGDGTRIDVLIDSESQRCMLKKATIGYALTVQQRKDRNSEGSAGYLKFKVPQPFNHIKFEDGRIPLTIVDMSDDSIVFQIPKTKPKPVVLQQEQKQQERLIERPFQLFNEKLVR